jgi:SAM-dependent methyltransferase
VLPSTPVLARWPVFPRALDAADWVLHRRDPRYAALPPASLRIRIGVGNRLLRNAEIFDDAHAIIRRYVEEGWVADGARVLDLGSGIGRNAVALRDQIEVASYDGIDVDTEMVAWCRKYLAGPTTRFHHADLYSAVYNPGGQPVAGYQLPLSTSSITFSLGISVFSHLVAGDAAHYASELGRVTAPGGFGCHTFFLLDHLDGHLGDRWTFKHQLDGCRVESTKYPEAAVAYREADVRAMFARHDFDVVAVLDVDRHQQTVVIRRR